LLYILIEICLTPLLEMWCLYEFLKVWCFVCAVLWFQDFLQRSPKLLCHLKWVTILYSNNESMRIVFVKVKRAVWKHSKLIASDTYYIKTTYFIKNICHQWRWYGGSRR
jgi:hypothetical protein